MEYSYNPFKNRYPNRTKIIADKNNYAGNLINQHKSKNKSINLDSLNNKNKQLSLFIQGKKISDKEINFPEKFIDYGKIPEQIRINLNNIIFRIINIFHIP